MAVPMNVSLVLSRGVPEGRPSMNPDNRDWLAHGEQELIPGMAAAGQRSLRRRPVVLAVYGDCRQPVTFGDPLLPVPGLFPANPESLQPCPVA
jgi:hypothetical protein